MRGGDTGVAVSIGVGLLSTLGYFYLSKNLHPFLNFQLSQRAFTFGLLSFWGGINVADLIVVGNCNELAVHNSTFKTRADQLNALIIQERITGVIF